MYDDGAGLGWYRCTYLVDITYFAKSMIDWPRTKDGICYTKGLSIRSGGGLLMNGSSLYRMACKASGRNHHGMVIVKNMGFVGNVTT